MRVVSAPSYGQVELKHALQAFASRADGIIFVEGDDSLFKGDQARDYVIQLKKELVHVWSRVSEADFYNGKFAAVLQDIRHLRNHRYGNLKNRVSETRGRDKDQGKAFAAIKFCRITICCIKILKE